MADGTSKPIDHIKVGDKIANTRPDDDSAAGKHAHTVTAVHITRDDHDYTDLTISTPTGSHVITGTSHHLYWDNTTRAWTRADHLHPGDHLQTTGHDQALIAALRSYTTSMVTYNLTIDRVHTYYVEAGNTPVLVHNTGSPELCPTSALKGDEPSTAERLKAAPEFTGGDLQGFKETNNPDYIDSYRRTYDAVGGPSAWARGNMQQVLNSIKGHLYLKTGLNFTVLDLTGASSGQIDTVFGHLDTWAADPTLKPRSRLIILGDGY